MSDQEKRKYFGENGNSLLDAARELGKTLPLEVDEAIDTVLEFEPDGYHDGAFLLNYETWIELETSVYAIQAAASSVRASATAVNDKYEILVREIAKIRMWKDHGGRDGK